MNVEQLMSWNPHTCRVDDTMHQAARILWDHDCGCAPVVDHESRVVGMITDRDICMAMYTQGRPLTVMKVASAMSTNVHAVRAKDSIAAAEQIMRKHKVRRLPVLDKQDHLVGLISLNDIACQAARERTKKHADITESEVAETLSSICEPRTKGALATVGI